MKEIYKSDDRIIKIKKDGMWVSIRCALLSGANMGPVKNEYKETMLNGEKRTECTKDVTGVAGLTQEEADEGRYIAGLQKINTEHPLGYVFSDLADANDFFDAINLFISGEYYEIEINITDQTLDAIFIKDKPFDDVVRRLEI